MSGSTAELRILITSKDSASQAIKGLGQNLGGLGIAGKVATAALASIAVAGGALAGVIGKSVGAAMDFESAMSAVGAVAGASGSELAALSQTALQLGQDTTLAGISASDAAKAMAELASGGISVADIMGGAARGALLLASAGGIDVARAAEIAAAALNNFGLAGSETGHIADLFAAAANSSAVTVTDLGESLKYIGPLAASMGLSIEEVTAALAEFGDQGIKGSQAGTSLRSILSSLAKPSKQASALIKELGLEFFDAGGKMKSIAGISEQLKTHLSGLTDQQRANALVTLFGNEALSAATVLYGEGAAGIAKYLGQVNVAGSAAANGAKRNDNLRGSIEQLKSSWETASIVLGTAFIPLVRQMVDLLAGAVNAAIPLIKVFGPQFVAALQAGIGQGVAIVRAFAAAVVATVNSIRTGDFSNLFGPLITAISTAFGSETAGKVTLFVSKLVTGLNLARDAVITARQAFAGDWVNSAAIAGPVATVGQLFLVLGNAVRTVQGWIAQIPAPVLAAAAAFLALGPAIQVAAVVLPALIGALTGLGPIVGVLTSTLPLLGSVIAAIGFPITALIVAVGLLAAAWATDFLGIQTATMPVIAAIGAAITGQLLPALQQVGPFISTNVMPGWVLAWQQMQTATTAALTAITPAVQQFVGFLQGSLLPGLQGIMAVAGPAFEQMKTAAVGAFQAALPGIQAFIAGVQQLGASVIPILAAVGRVIIDDLGPAVMAMVGWAQTVIPQFSAAFENVMSVVGPIVGELASLIGSALSAIAGFVNAHSAEITSVLTSAWNIISATIGAVFAVITGLISAGLQVIAGDWSGAWNTIQATTASVWASIQTIIGSAASIIGTIVSTAAHEWQALLSAAWAAIQSAAGEAMRELVAAIQAGMTSAASAVASGVAGFPAAVLAIGGAMFAAGASIIGQLTAGIASAIGAAISKVQEGLQQIANLLPHSEPKDAQSPLRGLGDAGRAIFTMLGAGIDKGAPEAVKAAADAASAVAKAITDGLSALTALSAFKGGPTGGQVSGFLGSLSDFMEKFITWTGGFEEDVLKAAQTFAGAASAAVGVIKGGVEGLQLLDSFVAPLGASVSGFLSSLADFMERFSTVAGGFEADVLETSSAFATAVKDAVGVLSSAVTGLMALANFKAPLESAVSAFLASLADFMERFGTVAGGFEADVLAVSSAFASGVSAAVGVLSNGVSGLMAIGDFAAPTQAAVSAFLASLADFMEKFATAASGFETDMLEQAKVFASAVGAVTSILGNGVEGFTKLLTFVAPSQQAIDNFVYAVFEAVRKIAEMASQMSTEGIKLAGDFGNAAGSVLTALKTGLDVFTGLAKLVVPSAKAIDDFAIAIAYTVARIGTIAEQIGKDGIKKAAEFGQSVQTIFGSLKSSMDILTNLEKFKDVAAKAFDSLLAGLQGAKDRAEGMVSQAKDLVLLSEEYLANMTKAAANFAKGQSLGGISGEEIGRSLGEGVASGARDALDAHSPSQVMAAIGKDVVDGLVQGMSDAQQDAAKKAADVASAVAKAITDTLGAAAALGKLDLTTLPTGGQITGILAFTRALVAEMAAASTMLDEDGAKATNQFSDAASKVAGAVSASVTALTSLVTFVQPADAAIFAFGKALRTAVNDLTVLAAEIPLELATSAAAFSEQAAKAVAIFGNAVSGIASVLGFAFTDDLKAGIFAFGKAVRVIIADFNYLAEELGLGLAESAGKFGEQVAKATGFLGTAAEGFQKLVGFAFTAPMKAGIYALGKAAKALIADFAYIVDELGIDLATKAGQLADQAAKVVTVVGTALGSFSGLATFVTPGKAAVDGLLATVRYIIARFGEMARTMSTEGTKQLGDFGAATNAVLGGVKSAIDTFIALDKATVPRTGDLSDLVVAVQGVTTNMADAAKLLGDDAIKDATAFGSAANGIFSALKAGLDLFAMIDKPGGWPTTDWLQPLIELMAGMLSRGGQLLSQAQQLRGIADQFGATMAGAYAGFATGLGGGGLTLTGNLGGSAGGGGGAPTTINNYTVTGNTLLSKDTATQQMVAGVVTTQQSRTIGYSTSG